MRRRWMLLAIAAVVLGLVGLLGFGNLVGPPAIAQLPVPTTRSFKLEPVGLLHAPQIKAELAITDEQLEKLPEAIHEALAKVLDEKQMLRFHQIELQRRGNSAIVDKDIVLALKMTDEQEKSLKEILDESAKEQREAFPKGTGGTLAQRMEKIEHMKKEAADKMMAVLNVEQKKLWTTLNGPSFVMQVPFTGAAPKKK
jgi:hypothetical protein